MAARAERDRLVRENLAIVGYLVNEVARKATHLSRDDLASAGALGLVMAAETFDPAQGVPFGAFARRRVLGAIADEMRAADWATRTARQRIKGALLVQESLTGALGRTPTLDELAVALGVDRAAAAEALADAGRSVSALDETTADAIVSDVVNPEDAVLETERTRYLTAAVESLPPRMRYVVEQIYFHDRAVGDLAVEMGLTHSAVSQQRSEAVRLLRDGLEHSYSTGQAPTVQAHSKVAPARRAAYLARLSETSSTSMASPAVQPAALRSVS